MTTTTVIVKDTALNNTVAQTITLLKSYSFDLQTTAEETVNEWLKLYNLYWLRLAVIEALYLGRYKAVSVEQILQVWQRRGSTNTHFNHEFERLICRNLPRHFTEIASNSSASSLPKVSSFRRNSSEERSLKNKSHPNFNHLSVVSQAHQDCSSAKLPNSQNSASEIQHHNQEHQTNKLKNLDRIETLAQSFQTSVEASNFLVKLKAVANTAQ